MIRNRGSWKMRSGSTSPRRGFTLLELLLVAILAATLILTLWSLFGTYLRLFDSGRHRADQAQLARAVIQQLTDDLRSVMLVSSATSSSLSPLADPFADPSTSVSEQKDNAPFGPPADSVAGSGSTSSVSSSSSSGGFSLGVPLASALGSEEASFSLPAFSLVGNDRRLEISVVQSLPPKIVDDEASDEVELNATAVREPLAAELQTVVYTFEPERVPDPTDRLPPPGLVRRAYAWDMKALHSDDASNQSGQSTEDTELSEMSIEDIADEQKETESTLWVREMTGLRLRYFDGQEWLAEWDSNQHGTLPLAVEIVFQLDSLEKILERESDDERSNVGVDETEFPEPQQDDFFNAEGVSTEEEIPFGSFRQVVYLPLASRQGSTSSESSGSTPSYLQNFSRSQGGNSP